MSTTDRMRMLDRIDRALTMLDCAEAIRDGGGAVEIAGVRITQGGKRPGFSKSGDDLAEAGRNDTAVVRDADGGAGKGSGTSSLPPLAGAGVQSGRESVRDASGPQNGVRSLGDKMREFAVELAGGIWTAFAASSAIEGFADRADALEAERDAECRSARAWRQAAREAQDELFRIHDILGLKGSDDLAGVVRSKLDALTTERDEARTEVESLQRAAQVTTTSWREHVERADKAEAAVARVRALLDRPLIPSALLRDALDGAGMGERE